MTELTPIQNIAIMAIPLIFAITLHEVAHGWVALYFGDHTARLAGRLSLNPIRHIDLFGTIILPGLLLLMNASFLFGWAKPVPVDSRNFKNPRSNGAIVALAGPLANLIMALLWGLIAKLGFSFINHQQMWFGVPIKYMGEAGMILNVVLAAINLIPLPPLDGGRVLQSLLPPRMAYHFSFIESYSFIILLVLLFSGFLNVILQPLVTFFLGMIGLILNI